MAELAGPPSPSGPAPERFTSSPAKVEGLDPNTNPFAPTSGGGGPKSEGSHYDADTAAGIQKALDRITSSETPVSAGAEHAQEPASASLSDQKPAHTEHEDGLLKRLLHKLGGAQRATDETHVHAQEQAKAVGVFHAPGSEPALTEEQRYGEAARKARQDEAARSGRSFIGPASAPEAQQESPQSTGAPTVTESPLTFPQAEKNEEYTGGSKFMNRLRSRRAKLTLAAAGGIGAFHGTGLDTAAIDVAKAGVSEVASFAGEKAFASEFVDLAGAGGRIEADGNPVDPRFTVDAGNLSALSTAVGDTELPAGSKLSLTVSPDLAEEVNVIEGASVDSDNDGTVDGFVVLDTKNVTDGKVDVDLGKIDTNKSTLLQRAGATIKRVVFFGNKGAPPLSPEMTGDQIEQNIAMRMAAPDGLGEFAEATGPATSSVEQTTEATDKANNAQTTESVSGPETAATGNTVSDTGSLEGAPTDPTPSIASLPVGYTIEGGTYKVTPADVESAHAVSDASPGTFVNETQATVLTEEPPLVSRDTAQATASPAESSIANNAEYAEVLPDDVRSLYENPDAFEHSVVKADGTEVDRADKIKGGETLKSAVTLNPEGKQLLQKYMEEHNIQDPLGALTKMGIVDATYAMPMPEDGNIITFRPDVKQTRVAKSTPKAYDAATGEISFATQMPSSISRELATKILGRDLTPEELASGIVATCQSSETLMLGSSEVQVPEQIAGDTGIFFREFKYKAADGTERIVQVRVKSTRHECSFLLDQTPEQPDIPIIPEQPDIPKIPKIPEQPEIPVTPDTPRTELPNTGPDLLIPLAGLGGVLTGAGGLTALTGELKNRSQRREEQRQNKSMPESGTGPEPTEPQAGGLMRPNGEVYPNQFAQGNFLRKLDVNSNDKAGLERAYYKWMRTSDGREYAKNTITEITQILTSEEDDELPKAA